MGPRVPGYNVDALDIEAGMRRAAALGWDDAMSQMAVHYALQRWARGEEQGAINTARVDGGVPYESFLMIVAAARAAAEG